MGLLERFKSKVQLLFEFDPKKSLFLLPVLRVTIYSITFLAFIVGLTIALHSNLEWRLDGEGFNYFVQQFKVPLGIWALLIPLVAVIGANHRSVQTKEQIEKTTEQNIFANHYKHLEEFGTYLKTILELESSELFDARKVHHRLYPNTLEGDLALSKEVLVKIEVVFKEIVSNFKQLNGDCRTTQVTSIDGVELALSQLEYSLYSECTANLISKTTGGSANVVSKAGDGSVIPASETPITMRSLFTIWIARAQIIKSILEFDPRVDSTPSLSKVCSIDIEKVPDHYLPHKFPAPQFELF